MNESTLKISRRIMFLAALYNLGWGAAISIFPQLMLYGCCATPFMLIILRCVGMLVGVYGIGYYFASTDPVRYWPLILTGLTGKVLGPLGALFYIFLGQLDPDFFWLNFFNDIIWIVPFGWILWQVRKHSSLQPGQASPPL